MTKSNFDAQLEKALHLMDYERKPLNEGIRTNVQFYKMGADDKVYGIIREGAKFIIKTTEPGKEKLAESYSYIGGVNNIKANAYRDYNEATKQLELKLMSLNEAYGKKLSTSTIDFDKNEKTFANLTEEARKAIDRANQIFENSFISKDNIGNHGNPEGKGTATGANTTKNNAPFEDKAEAKLDKDVKENGTVKGATPDNKEVGNGVDADLQSDKMKTANSGSEKDYKDTHDDLDGKGVADKKPAGGKVVRVNEGFFTNPDVPEDEQLPDTPEEIDVDMENMDEEPMVDEPMVDEPESDITNDTFEDDTDLVGFDDDTEDVDLETMIREFEEEFNNGETIDEESKIVGPDKVLDGPHGTDGADADWERVDESFCDDDDDDALSRFCKDPKNHLPSKKEQNKAKKAAQADIEKDKDEELDESQDGNVNDEPKETGEKAMKGPNGSLGVQTWDKMNESIDRIVDEIYARLTEDKKTKKETLQEKVDRIVKEEVTKLDAWGKHPRYQKPAFQTPANKEVLAGTAEKDWNDDSTKGDAPYGKKIGNSAPFDKVVNMLTDAVLANIKESFKK